TELFTRVRSNDTRPLWVQVRNFFNYEGGKFTINPGLDANLLVGGRIELSASAGWSQWFGRRRWIGTGSSGLPLFGALELEQLEVTLRGTAAFTRDLSLQLFGQLLRSAQHYSSVYVLRDPLTLTPCEPATCMEADPPASYDRDLTSLIVNTVLRWEFRPGSTLYVVYTHNHQIQGQRGRFALGDSLSALGSTPADNVIALKLSYLWAL